MIKLASAAVLTAALSTLTGCQSDPVRAPYTPNQDLVTQQTYPKITISGDLVGWLLVDQPSVAQDPLLHVSVPVRSGTSTGQWMKVQYRFIFLDADHVPVRAQPDWKSETLEPRQQVFMQGNALDTNAVDWRMEIRTHH